MSSFGTLNTAVSGLLAAQRAMETTSQNVVNANTPGYSRQRVLQSAMGATSTATYHTGTQLPVGGVKIDGVIRIRDAFIEATRAAAGGRQEALAARNATLSGAQQLLSEPGSNGLQAGLDSFYASWHELSLNPTDGAAGAVVIQKGIAVTDQLHAVGNGIAAQWTDAHTRLRDVVTQANQAASDLAGLNIKVAEAISVGRPVNELLDQRDTLVRSLADLVGAQAIPGQDGQISVSVNGITVVAGGNAQPLTLAGATSIDLAATSPPTLRWGTVDVPIESGAAAGHLATLRTDLPDLLTDLDGVAQALRDAVNTVHATGFTLAGAAGGAFFAGTGARDLSVAVSDPADLAISSAAGTVDGAVALKIGDLAGAAAPGGGPGAVERWRNLTTALGTQVQSLTAALSVQEAVVATADDAVAADSGVSLDEEMTGMLMYQRAYQASARVITTIDEMIDTLVNRTGTVGR
jgi:flagellar hook-associated protein 1 FlgK